MTENIPRVSVGLPVYNGENYLRYAVDSVLAQTFQDWELIISDNCSTDATAAICREYAARDPRVRYFRNEKNLGGIPNHNRTVDLARGQYFKYYAHDDVLLPTFLERCVEALDREPSYLMAHTKTMIIDAKGKELHPNPWQLRTASSDPRIRFKDLVWTSHHSFQIYGLMRIEELRKTPLLGVYLSSDQMLLAELSLRGPFYEVDEYLFLSRRHSEQSVSILPSYMRGKPRTFFGRVGQLPHLGWADTSKEKAIAFPMWRLIVEYFMAIGRSPVSMAIKLWCWALLIPYSFKSWHRLGRDLLVAADKAIQQTAWAEGIAAKRQAAEAQLRGTHDQSAGVRGGSS